MLLKAPPEVINDVFIAQPQRLMEVNGIEIGDPSPAASQLVSLFEHNGLPHVIVKRDSVPEHLITETRLPETVLLHFPTTHHKRSFSVRGEEAPDRAVSVKGAVIADDSILWSGARRTPALYGRQGLSFLPRIIRVGSYLEQQGEASERVDAVFVHSRVVPIYFDGSVVLQSIKKFRHAFELKVAIESTETDPSKRAVQKLIAREFTPAVTVRSMPDNMRLVDLLKLTEDERKVKINRVYNRAEQKEGVDPDAQYAFWVVGQMGQRLATWHNQLEITHGYPHSGNWTAGGHLVDNDSVKGAPLGLGDTPITIEAIQRDLRFMARDFRTTGLVLSAISNIIPAIDQFNDMPASQLADFAIFVTQLYLNFASAYDDTLKRQDIKNPALMGHYNGNLDYELFVPDQKSIGTTIFEFASHLASFGQFDKERELIIRVTRRELRDFLEKRTKRRDGTLI